MKKPTTKNLKRKPRRRLNVITTYPTNRTKRTHLKRNPRCRFIPMVANRSKKIKKQIWVQKSQSKTLKENPVADSKRSCSISQKRTYIERKPRCRFNPIVANRSEKAKKQNWVRNLKKEKRQYLCVVVAEEQELQKPYLALVLENYYSEKLLQSQTTATKKTLGGDYCVSLLLHRLGSPPRSTTVLSLYLYFSLKVSLFFNFYNFWFCFFCSV